MEKHWWYEKNEQQKGPVTQQDLVRLLSQDYLNDDNFVWQHGMRSWVKVREIKDNILHEHQQIERAQAGKTQWLSILVLSILLAVLAYIIIVVK